MLKWKWHRSREDKAKAWHTHTHRKKGGVCFLTSWLLVVVIALGDHLQRDKTCSNWDLRLCFVDTSATVWPLASLSDCCHRETKSQTSFLRLCFQGQQPVSDRPLGHTPPPPRRVSRHTEEEANPPLRLLRLQQGVHQELPPEGASQDAHRWVPHSRLTTR